MQNFNSTLVMLDSRANVLQDSSVNSPTDTITAQQNNNPIIDDEIPF